MKMTVTAVFAALLLSACGGAEKAMEDSVAATLEAKTPTLAEFSGSWDMSTKLEGVEAPVLSKLAGTGDSPNWAMTLEGRPAITVRVMVVGDSLIGESDPYESILRKGVQVTVRTATALTSPTTLQGSFVATYTMPSGVEKVAGVTTGTKAQ